MSTPALEKLVLTAPQGWEMNMSLSTTPPAPRQGAALSLCTRHPFLILSTHGLTEKAGTSVGVN